MARVERSRDLVLGFDLIDAFANLDIDFKSVFPEIIRPFRAAASSGGGVNGHRAILSQFRTRASNQNDQQGRYDPKNFLHFITSPNHYFGYSNGRP
jgi:hypothetical protein